MTLDELNAALRDAAEAIQERYEPTLASRYESVLRSAGRIMEERFRAKAVPALTAGAVHRFAPGLIAAATFLPPDEDDVVPDSDAGRQTAATRRRAARTLQAELEAAGLSFSVGGIFSEELLEQIGSRATFATDRELRGIFRGVIEKAMAEGWSVPQTAREIRTSVQSMAGHRATALARTDLIGLANAGNHMAARQATQTRERGTTFKQWLATLDDRTRPDHAAAHGQTVPMEEPFDVGGEPLQYPGDPGGSAENVMNCRCTTLYQDSLAGAPAIRAAAHTTEAAMPYHIEKRDEKFCVIKDDDDDVMGCHDTRQEAQDQIAAIEANEEASVTTTMQTEVAEPEAEAPARDPVPFDAVLCVEGEPTEDMRLIERGSLSWRDLPLTLMGMIQNPELGGHGLAQVSGRIDSIERRGDDIESTGELTTEFGVDTLAPMIRDKTVRGVSVDLAVLDYEYRNADTGEPISLEEIFFNEDEDLRVLFVVTEGVILGATVCPMQAVENASIAVVASADGRPQLRMTIFTPFPQQETPLERFNRGAMSADEYRALTAAATAPRPSSAAFATSEFPGPTPLTVTDDGRVFGHIATWDTCHVGIPGVCTTAPRSASGYAYFHTGEIVTEEDENIAVGKIVFGTKHASIEASRQGAARHYDDSGKVGAIVRAYDGDFGIWVSGIVRPGASQEDIAALRLNPPSGDWRRVNGSLELIAALSVPVPGFPTPRAEAGIRASADVIEVTALIASAGLIVPDALVASAMEDAGCTNLPERIDGVQEIAALLD